MLTSALFGGDPLLEQIANDENGQRISTTQNKHDPAVAKVQEALLIWNPISLPTFGADGDYGGETAAAVHRFKVDFIGVSEEQVIDDVGPQTVISLDTLAFADEQSHALAARIAEIDSWLTPALSGVFSSVSTSDVTVHISGTDAFVALNDALMACVDDRALVMIAGWDFFDNTPLVPGVTIGDALRTAATRGAKVCALFNRFPEIDLPLVGIVRPVPGNNTGAVAFVNTLPGGAAIHDGRVLHHLTSAIGINNPLNIPLVTPLTIQIGVHHQKAWVVWTGERLFAWVGGVDINPNRTGPTALHDVQVQLHGQAAVAVYNVLRNRWNDHPDVPPGVTLPLLTPETVTGTHRCRIVTTFGDPSQFAGLNGAPYSFAPAGSKATRQLLFHMMRKAQNCIYIEDQYFVDDSIGQELANNMAHLNALIVVITDVNGVNNELSQAIARRRAAFNHLLPFKQKVAVVFRNNRFVHAKVWVFDDTVAMVGSTNVNRRGYEHDSEMGAVFGDLLGRGSARELRERLWALHLGPAAPAIGSNPVVALPIWQSPPADSFISTYDWTVGNDPNPVPVTLKPFLTPDAYWDNIVDPHCP